MISDEFAIDHLNGLRISYTSKDVENRKDSASRQMNGLDNSTPPHKHRRHKKSSKLIFESSNDDSNGTFEVNGDHSNGVDDGEQIGVDDEVPHRRQKIGGKPVNGHTERKRSSSRRKPQSLCKRVKTKLPELPIQVVDSSEKLEDEKPKFAVDVEDVVYHADVSRAYDSISEPRVTPMVASKEQHPGYVQKDDGNGYTRRERAESNTTKLTVDETACAKTGLISNRIRSTRLEFILKMHTRFRSVGTMSNGLVAGLALAQCIFVFSFTNENLRHAYSNLAILFQSVYYLLLTLSTVAVLDRFFNIGSDWAEFLNHLIARPLRAIILISYVLSLIFSVSLAQLDDILSTKLITRKKLDTWKALNMFRVITSIIGWLAVAFSPLDDVTARSIENMMGETEEDDVIHSTSRCEINPTPVNMVTSHEEL